MTYALPVSRSTFGEGERPWFIYILRCSDSSLYTGISTNVDKRIANHNAKKGASYTKSRTPVTLVFKEGPMTESFARKCEFAIKKLTREEKELFIKAHLKIVQINPISHIDNV